MPRRWQYWWQLSDRIARSASKPIETRPRSKPARYEAEREKARLLGLLVVAPDATLNHRVAGSTPARPIVFFRQLHGLMAADVLAAAGSEPCVVRAHRQADVSDELHATARRLQAPTSEEKEGPGR